jgi:hypothetical protein
MIAQSDHELDSSELSSQENLESLYAKIVRIPDRRKARELTRMHYIRKRVMEKI